MDPRRVLIFPVASLALGACAILPRRHVPSDAAPPATSSPLLARSNVVSARAGAAGSAPALTLATADRVPNSALVATPRTPKVMAPIPNPGPATRSHRARPAAGSARAPVGDETARSGPAAIAAANASARETSRARGFLGGVQVFAYEPGRVYEVWTAPLRVTTLTLSPGEMVVSPALKRLLDSGDGTLLRDRLPYRVVGTIGEPGLIGSHELAYYAGAKNLASRINGWQTARITEFGNPQPSSDRADRSMGDRHRRTGRRRAGYPVLTGR